MRTAPNQTVSSTVKPEPGGIAAEAALPVQNRRPCGKTFCSVQGHDGFSLCRETSHAAFAIVQMANGEQDIVDLDGEQSAHVPQVHSRPARVCGGGV